MPWQFIAEGTGAEFRIIPLDDSGDLVARRLSTHASGTSKVVAAERRLELAGNDQRISKLAAWAHTLGAILVCDGPRPRHTAVDVQTLGADFVAVSGHKMLGPSGIGSSGAVRSCSTRWTRSCSAAT